MKWKKAPSELVDMIDEAMTPFDCQRRLMFGYPAFFVNNNMFAGLHRDSMIIRLSESDRERIVSDFDEATIFEPMPGRKMKEYIELPEAVYGDSRLLDAWLKRSFDFASALPLKEPKKKRPASPV